MDPSLSVQSVQIVVLIILLLASGFFSASETALMAISKIEVRHMVAQNMKGATRLEKLLEDQNKLLGSILVGNNLVNIGASSLATVIATKLFDNSGVGIATGVMTILVLIFGEITPKSLSTQNTEKMALLVSGPISIVVAVFSPVVKVLMFITNGILRLFGVDPNATKPFITAGELKTIVNVSHEEGVLMDEEKEMICNVFDFGSSAAKDIMVPRTDMIAIGRDATYEEILSLYKEDPCSRMPVYEESVDNIVGILHIKDLLLHDFKQNEFHIDDFLREPYFVHEFKRNDELFKEMRAHKVGMCIVLDEYGGTAGLVTMEDLIEEIVGDIDDEYDETENEIQKVSDHEYLIEGSARLTDVNELLNLDITSEDFDSIGGFVIGLFDRFPTEGEEITYNDIKFIVDATSNNRINTLKILLQ
nr:hemolysin family protein [uncultured Cellulosilyticum sp.]